VVLLLHIDTRKFDQAMRRATAAVRRLGRALGDGLARHDAAMRGQVILRAGRRVHRSTVRPARLPIDGHAYRNRTRRRTRKARR
jgi:hypothetical protein